MGGHRAGTNPRVPRSSSLPLSTAPSRITRFGTHLRNMISRTRTKSHGMLLKESTSLSGIGRLLMPRRPLHCPWAPTPGAAARTVCACGVCMLGQRDVGMPVDLAEERGLPNRQTPTAPKIRDCYRSLHSPDGRESGSGPNNLESDLANYRDSIVESS